MKRLTALLCGACLLLNGCTVTYHPPGQEIAETAPKTPNSLGTTGILKPQYAQQFTVVYLEGGYAAIMFADGQRFFLVPEGAPPPENPNGYTILQQPLKNLYVAASSAVDLFDGIGALDEVKLTSTKDWTLPRVQEALDSGKMQYIGKYSTPDYEKLLEAGCGLAVESTMIYHTPETKEQLETLGIPVLVERSSYEEHPLGRMEWIRLYGLLLGKQAEAEAFFAEKAARFDEIAAFPVNDADRPDVAFFYITSNGMVNVRKPGDYLSKMIELAGGRYCLTADDLNVEENALSTMNISMESFYALAKDADILIYNATIDGELQTLDQLLQKDAMLGEFKAFKEGKVWCSEQDMFQQTTGAADMIADLHSIFYADGAELTFLHALR